MQATSFTHVSIHSTDVEESAAFYESLLGVERVPAPNFGSPTVWLRIGDLQLHLFERDVTAPELHHFGIAVDDFNEFYERASADSFSMTRIHSAPKYTNSPMARFRCTFGTLTAIRSKSIIRMRPTWIRGSPSDSSIGKHSSNSPRKTSREPFS
jgi:hypothetical protein